ncbi:hypothetical protein [Taibaiella koreensis]|uniref:hypothetical protein n=1 Tax=Taibaiella koreensis TaxID=1268548 RepID=UPI001968EEBD|nr:hypothetical protein [Taibaiella koreensis]
MRNKQEVLLSLLSRLDRSIQSSDYNKEKQACLHCPCRFDPLLTRVEAAAYTGFEPGTLATWDYTKRYDLQPIRYVNAVRYRLSSINRFADLQINPDL